MNVIKKFEELKVDDIVVSLCKKYDYRNVGDMFKVLQLKSNYKGEIREMYYRVGRCSEEPKTWRKATEEEMLQYRVLDVRNIKDIIDDSAPTPLDIKHQLLQ